MPFDEWLRNKSAGDITVQDFYTLLDKKLDVATTDELFSAAGTYYTMLLAADNETMKVSSF